MPVRSKTTHGALRRRRIGSISREREASRQTSAAAQGAQAQDHPVLDRRLRQGGPCQDSALYSCGCGYAFDAPVSTSVDCPHCGDRQAW